MLGSYQDISIEENVEKWIQIRKFKVVMESDGMVWKVRSKD